MKTGFIFSAGSFYDLYKLPEPEDLIIAADAGLLLCQKLNLTPDLVIGDFDSVRIDNSDLNAIRNSQTDPADLNGKVLQYPIEKDDTDTMLAIKKAIELGCGEIYIYGGTGGRRMDHTVANIASLGYARSMGCRAFLYDDNFVYTVISSEELVIKKTGEDGLLSVFAFGGDASGVSIRGTQYTLENAILHSNFPLGVSNHMRDDMAVISCKQGSLLVGWQLT